MAQTRETLLEEKDLYGLPDDGRRYELEDGHLISEPSPGAKHGRVASRINIALGSFVIRQNLGVVFTCDTGFVLARNPDTVRAPDVSFITTDRYLALEDDNRAIPGPPDLAIDILSPSDRRGRTDAKLLDYWTARTRLVWIVDPRAETVGVYCHADRAWVYPPEWPHALLRGSDELTGADVLPDFRIRVADFFRI